ncbi:MAG: hypothetical protein ACE5HS_17675 [bacterium]
MAGFLKKDFSALQCPSVFHLWLISHWRLPQKEFEAGKVSLALPFKLAAVKIFKTVIE